MTGRVQRKQRCNSPKKEEPDKKEIENVYRQRQRQIKKKREKDKQTSERGQEYASTERKKKKRKVATEARVRNYTCVQ